MIASDQKPDGSWVPSCRLCSDCRTWTMRGRSTPRWRPGEHVGRHDAIVQVHEPPRPVSLLEI